MQKYKFEFLRYIEVAFNSYAILLLGRSPTLNAM